MSSPPPAPDPARNNRILVIDDEPSMREMLGIMLGKEGYEVALADSRAAAARALATGKVGMVITDVKLPDGDGIEILRHVKAASPDMPAGSAFGRRGGVTDLGVDFGGGGGGIGACAGEDG